MRILKIAAVAFILFAVNNEAKAQEKCQWKWARMGVFNDGWDVQQGDAEVTISKSGFTAKLFERKDHNNVVFSISGKIAGNKVNASETRHNSDGYSVLLTGTLKKYERLDESSCRLSMMLGEPFNHVGLLSVPANREKE